tara:strand:- start:6948 stop:7481 length:534 start_codon:yes stop_codon:yes gene_type:complete
MSEELKQYILKSGFLLGIIYIFIDVYKYIGGAEFFLNYYLAFASIALSIIFPIYYSIQFRKSIGGFIDFRTAFSSCTGILIAAGFIHLVFQILLFNLIDTQFATALLDETINMSVQQLEAFGMSESEIEQTIESMEDSSSYNPMNMLKGFGFMVVCYTLFGLIVASFIKKEKSIFSN